MLFNKIVSLLLFLVGMTVVPVFAEESAEALSAKAAQEWLALVDQGNYKQSWSTASPRLQLTMSQAQWEEYLKTARHDLGAVKSREIAKQQDAQDPKGLPEGNYMVILYQTSFTSKEKAAELLTLSQGIDGKWRVLTYFIK